MKKIASLMLIFLFCSVSSLVADSQNTKGQKSIDKFLKRFDTNKSKKITTEEFTKAWQKRWNKLDANKDGVVTEQELQDNLYSLPKRFQKSNPLFKRYDKNHDGKITQNEGPRGRFRKRKFKKFFSRYDKNHDGAITLEEAYRARSKWVVKFKTKLYKRFFKRLDKNHSQYLESNEMKKKQELFSLADQNKDGKISLEEFKTIGAKKFLQKVDLNKDGQVTKLEFQTVLEKRFKILDANSDGTITYKELKDYLKNRKNSRRAKKTGEKKTVENTDNSSTNQDEKVESNDDDATEENEVQDDSQSEAEDNDEDLEDALGEL